jgi:hypothetical protein
VNDRRNENKFREVEGWLDAQFAALQARLDAEGIVARDCSSRHYHYKNQILTWSFSFVRDAEMNGETERVTVLLTYSEPLRDEGELTVLIRAEVFQRAQISRIDLRHEYVVELEQVRRNGLQALVMESFVQGAELLSS